MLAYYNEIDPFKAEWLRQLIAAGHIANGVVDERSIADVNPEELRQYTQCHFFAGIGAWSCALRQAGWPDDRPVWTGSCPCPSFSSAGKGKGFSDPRHLWPELERLIRECQPDTIFGEQVATAIGHGWFDLVSTDLENQDYAVGSCVLGAHSVGAPHIRQRLYFVANPTNPRTARLREHSRETEDQETERNSRISGCCRSSELAHTECQRGYDRGRKYNGSIVKNEWHDETIMCHNRKQTEKCLPIVGMADNGTIGRKWRERTEIEHESNGQDAGRVKSDSGTTGSSEDVVWSPTLNRFWRSAASGVECSEGRGKGPAEQCGRECSREPSSQTLRTNTLNGFWRDADWIGCRDGRWRPVESGTFPLANGASCRVGRLRGYGDAIVSPTAQAFIESYLEVEKDLI